MVREIPQEEAEALLDCYNSRMEIVIPEVEQFKSIVKCLEASDAEKTKAYWAMVHARATEGMSEEGKARVRRDVEIMDKMMETPEFKEYMKLAKEWI